MKVFDERQIGRNVTQRIVVDDLGDLWIAISVDGRPSGGFHCNRATCGPLAEALARAESDPPDLGPCGSIAVDGDRYDLVVGRAFYRGAWRGSLALCLTQRNGTVRQPRVYEGATIEALSSALACLLAAA